MAVTDLPYPPDVARLRRRILFSTASVLVGVAWSTVGDSTLGGLVTVTAFVVLVATLHRYGRTGPA